MLHYLLATSIVTVTDNYGVNILILVEVSLSSSPYKQVSLHFKLTGIGAWIKTAPM